VDDKIELRIAPAIETLRSLPAGEQFDLAFIDADKPNYDAYYEGCLRVVRPGGLILIDNVLWSGEVADASATGESVEAIRALNAKVAADERVDHVLLPLADGLTMARRRT
jgi:predicted O-methyltransferase YrrM